MIYAYHYTPGTLKPGVVVVINNRQLAERRGEPMDPLIADVDVYYGLGLTEAEVRALYPEPAE